MERRKFLKTSAVGSSCVLAGSFIDKSAVAQNTSEYKCKITVLKRTLNTDWDKKYRKGEGSKCSVFSDGQEFIIESPWAVPDGFCHWAWADIRTFIHMVNDGKFETFVSCCTDGFRPVFFKIQRIKV